MTAALKKIQVVDVSHWDGPIDMKKVKTVADGVMMKVTQGTTYVDPMFRQYYKDAKAAGLLVGFYHFADISSTADAQAEADFFWSNIKDLKADLPHGLDLEQDRFKLTPDTLTTAALMFAKQLNSHDSGHDILLYTYQAFIQTQLTSAITQLPLWIAAYNDNVDTGFWKAWRAHQYTSSGTVPGVVGKVDLDIMYIEAPTKPAPAKPTSPVKVPTGTYIVESGDTLSEIATAHHTTVDELVKINHIQKANLIYPGEKILFASPASHPAVQSITYTIKSGDNLTKIADAYKTTVQALVKLNHLAHPDVIQPGQHIKIR